MTARQLPLPFAHRPDFAPADFLTAPSNAEALAWLARTNEWPGGRLALWGEAGCGKTHLLHVWAARAGAALVSADDLPAGPPTRPLAIDDADTDAYADQAAREEALLHLLNAAEQAGFPVLLAGRAPPARWPVALPDLASRLRATASVQVRPPDDALLRPLFGRLLADRQLAVAEHVQDYLLLHLPRTPAALREAAYRLDRAALATGRAVTRPVAAAVVATVVAAGTEPPPAEKEISVHTAAPASP